MRLKWWKKIEASGDGVYINDKRNGIWLPDTIAAAHKGTGVLGKGYK